MPSLPRLVLLLFALLTATGLASARAQTVELPPRDDAPRTLNVHGAVLKVHFVADEKRAPRRLILDWVARSARAVALYYGRFPLPEANILIVTVSGRGVKGGRAFGGPNAYLRVIVGRDSTAADLAKDWVMVHEMIHLAIPVMDDRHDWLSEGLAVYVESVARLQAGDLDESTVWQGFVEGMAHGVPKAGDEGLDFTPTWGRTYWGGAIFCLFADLEIRKRSHGRKTLQDALRGVLAQGDFRKRWPIREVLSSADAATGTSALMELYEAWRATAVDPELPELWKRLGVRLAGRSVSFDDSAALAGVRKEIGQVSEN
jgi:hypothetical protein